MILNIAEFSLSNWVTYGFSFVGGFHLMEIPACVPIHLHLRSPRNCSLAPESPRWLIAHCDVEQAARFLPTSRVWTPRVGTSPTMSKKLNPRSLSCDNMMSPRATFFAVEQAIREEHPLSADSCSEWARKSCSSSQVSKSPPTTSQPSSSPPLRSPTA
jgi:hypothetical protein